MKLDIMGLQFDNVTMDEAAARMLALYRQLKAYRRR